MSIPTSQGTELQECTICHDPGQSKKPWTASGMLVAGVSGALTVGACAMAVPFLAPAFRRVCLPFVPATTIQVNNVMRALRGRSGSLLDIGSGDGRIVIEASRHGFQSTGVELNYWLVLYSRYKAWKEGQWQSTAFLKKDLWKTDMSKYDNIVIFGADTLMKDLEDKFDREITDSCQVMAARFPLPSWEPVSVIGEGLDTVWVYKHPSNLDCKRPENTARNIKTSEQNFFDKDSFRRFSSLKQSKLYLLCVFSEGSS